MGYICPKTDSSSDFDMSHTKRNFLSANFMGWVLEGLSAEFMHLFYSKMYISAQMYNFCAETTFLCRSKG